MTIQADNVFIYPTDTVWGIGCSLYSEAGHARIAEIKRTSKDKPLSIMFSSVQDVYNSFNFSSEVTLSWLETFFSLETTLGLPLKSAKIKIPKWATGGSDFVSLRCLSSEVICKIHSDLQTPFFTTSLNLTGSEPIVNTAVALNFHRTHAPDALMFQSSNQALELSGLSSSIIFLKENLDFEIKREGRKIEEVKQHLMKLFSE